MTPITYAAVGISAIALLSMRKVKSIPDSNIGAFLSVIREYESGNDYASYVSFNGRDSFKDFSGHPIETGEKGYVIRPDDGRPTSAAGAYQIVYSTWDSYGIRQTDFSPYSQDNAAIALIKRRGAYYDIANGDIDSAFYKLVNEWESLKIKGLDKVKSAFVKNGGVIAQ